MVGIVDFFPSGHHHHKHHHKREKRTLEPEVCDTEFCILFDQKTSKSMVEVGDQDC